MSHKKTHLENKICLVCNMPFDWRKNWQDCWDDVKYCSKQWRLNAVNNLNYRKKNNGENNA